MINILIATGIVLATGLFIIGVILFPDKKKDNKNISASRTSF